MSTAKSKAMKVRKEIKDLGGSLKDLSKTALGEATNKTLNAAEKALTTAQRRLEKVRTRTNKPGR